MKRITLEAKALGKMDDAYRGSSCGRARYRGRIDVECCRRRVNSRRENAGSGCSCLVGLGDGHNSGCWDLNSLSDSRRR